MKSLVVFGLLLNGLAASASEVCEVSTYFSHPPTAANAIQCTAAVHPSPISSGSMLSVIQEFENAGYQLRTVVVRGSDTYIFVKP